mmetsp:Transcript_29175/g.49063  ORF Transcript_29175/g.49063 Transcript_29175/m.49063 type:complete len:184 (-) Transcript_29175:25-576(-)
MLYVYDMGSICMLYVDDVAGDALGRKGITRLQILASTALLMAATQFLLSFGSSDLLYVCLLLVGFCFGAAFSNIAAIVADLWGTQYVASNYGFLDLSPIMGSYIFSTGLIAGFYPKDSGDDDGNDDGDDYTCVGVHCFQHIFFITSACGVFATIVCYVLHVFTPMRPRMTTTTPPSPPTTTTP